VILISLASILALVSLGYVMLNWGRTYIYDEKGVNKDLPVFGKKITDNPDRFSLEDKDNKVTMINASDVGNYDKNAYKVTYFPAQKTLDYSVGYFVEWESINNSGDKYLILRDEENGLTKYRVMLSSSPESLAKHWNKTAMVVEDFRQFYGIKKTGISVEVLMLNKIGFEKLNKVIKKGDAVVVFPRGIGQTNIDVIDESDNYVLQMMAIRRFFGIYELKLELSFLNLIK